MTVRLSSDQQWRSLLADQFSQSGRLLYRLAYGILRDAATTEDVCQQALLKAWEKRDELRDESGLRSWLARVVVTESLQIRRRRTIERRVMPAQHDGDVASPVSAPMDSVDALHATKSLTLEPRAGSDTGERFIVTKSTEPANVLPAGLTFPQAPAVPLNRNQASVPAPRRPEVKPTTLTPMPPDNSSDSDQDQHSNKFGRMAASSRRMAKASILTSIHPPKNRG